jgi:hypothetical protein
MKNENTQQVNPRDRYASRDFCVRRERKDKRLFPPNGAALL